MRATLKFLVLSTAVIGWLSVASHRADAVVTITLGSTTGMPGDTVPVTATLSTGTDMVAGTQNDITIPTGLSIGMDADGNPNCAVNPAIRKTATSFAYLPAGCTVGTTCTGVRSIVLSLTNVTAIPDGSVLYTCQVAIANNAPSGDLTLNNTNANASDPSGGQLATTAVSGVVTVGGGPSTPVVIHVGSGSGAQGSTATFDVTLESGVDVAGTQNDIAFEPKTRIPLNDEGNPDCTVNPDIRKTATSFAYLPAGCTPATDCVGIRAIVLSLTNVTVIPNGARLYSCNVAIAADATDGMHPLACTNANASDPQGGQLETSCTNGSITVGGVILPTPTTTPATGIATMTATALPTTPSVTATATVGTPGATGTVTVTRTVGTPVATGTVTRTGGATGTVTRTVGTPGATNTVTRTSGVSTPTTKPTARVLEDDGCAVVSPTDASNGWMLLLPAAMLLWVRRRTR